MSFLKSKFCNIDINAPLPEYPRPQLERDSFLNLNGIWQYAITPSLKEPEHYDGNIVVPFSPEAPLSGVMKQLAPDQYLWYKRSFSLPEGFMKDRLIINFGAVDRHALVYVNGKEACRHSGGYTPFSADITDLLNKSGENILTVRVRDESDSADTGGRGKQKTDRKGIWYTPQSGIWQTVWLESVPENYITALRITPDFDQSKVDIFVGSTKKSTCTLEIGGKTYGLASNGSVSITIKDLIPWTPENPHLYPFTVKMGADLVKSYFAIRKISLETDKFGKKQLFLNGKPYCQFGLLDQGYHCGGYYTPPTDEAMIYDIELAKKMGFNMLRKHIKIEPLRWYYHCDRLGMIVWQDMVNGGGSYKFTTISLPLVTGRASDDTSYGKFSRSFAPGRAAFISETEETVSALYNCPSILVWTVFNEGWGQFDSKKLTERVRSLDKTRMIDTASGWHDLGYGDISSRHVYFKKYRFKPDKFHRAPALSEYGGYSLFLKGHTFSDKKFGYKHCRDREHLTSELIKLFNDVFDVGIKNGISAFVYTQLSDVEDEVNGIITYDRAVLKIDPKAISSLIKSRLDEYSRKFSSDTDV